MSRPVGSACCDWTVSGGFDATRKDNVFTCDNCKKECEVML